MKTTQTTLNRDSAHHGKVNQESQTFFSGQLNGSGSFFSPVIVQPKLKIGAPDDPYERQADRVAEAVVSSPAPVIQQQSMEEEEETLQMKCLDCEKEESLQMKSVSGQATGTAPPAIAQKIQNAGGGNRLPETVSNEMSQKMGADFSNVNIHTGPEASRLNQSLGARAFTHGTDVFFNSGEYNPGSKEGKRLLAHELTHVVQQGKGLKIIQRQLDPRERVRRRARFFLRSEENGITNDVRFSVTYSASREIFIERVRQELSGLMVSSNPAERAFARELINYFGDVDEIFMRYRNSLEEGETVELVARILRRDVDEPTSRWIVAIRVIDRNFVNITEGDSVEADISNIRERELIQLNNRFENLIQSVLDRMTFIESNDSHNVNFASAIGVYCNNLIRLSRGENTMIPAEQSREFARPYVEAAIQDWQNLTSNNGRPALQGHTNEVISSCRAWARQALLENGNTRDPQVIENYVNTFNGYRNY